LSARDGTGSERGSEDDDERNSDAGADGNAYDGGFR